MIPADVVTAPRWSEIAVAATSGSAATLNLDTVGPQTASNATTRDIGARQRYIRVKVFNADCSIVFAANATKAGNVTHLTAGTNQTTGGYPISAGTYEDFCCPSDFQVLGFITGGGAGFIVVYINSRPL
jgi:hypothetical protein